MKLTTESFSPWRNLSSFLGAAPKAKRNRRKTLALLLALVMCVSQLLALPAGNAAFAADAEAPFVLEQPALLVVGADPAAGEDAPREKSYTLSDLQAVAAGDPDATEDNQYVYTAFNNAGTKSFYRGEGVRIEALVKLQGIESDPETIAVRDPDNYRMSYNPKEPRYFFPKLYSDSEEDKTLIPAIITWAGAGGRNTAPIVSENTTPPATVVDYEGKLGTMVGQRSTNDVNNSLFSDAAVTQTILLGAEAPEVRLTVVGAEYTRAALLMLPRAEHTYTYINSGGERNDLVRGVPLALLLDNLNDHTALEFHAADDYAVSMNGMTKGELTAANAILAYEMWNAATGTWASVYDGSAPTQGYFRLYIDGARPAQRIDDISVDANAKSLYKHISYDGAPYNLDAITGATLTVEGPGVEASVPITVRELEETGAANIYRDVYTDNRAGVSATRMYEGVKVLSILDGLVNENVKPLDDNVVVVFKNRWRQEVGRLAYGEIKYATAPVLLAYGTAYTDESTVSPFVFIGGTGINIPLGNDDGPLKLVYNQGGGVASQFPSVAYMYVEEGTPPPGFKHIDATNDAYNNVANSEFILTFTGNALGREVNYTVRELEEMAGANPGLSHRDDYSLSNTTYWYVNEYEGIKLWDLLVSMGVDESQSADEATLVSFASWDNYQVSAMFSLYQLAHPELFYFYEKSPLDIGLERPSKEQLSDPAFHPGNQVGEWVLDANGFPVKTGYPVMLAYGVNSYPYVRDPGLDGYKSGLGNSGGPMRLIYGKTDGLNRTNPDALENYAYFFNNGSQQLQRLQEIYVGDAARYSTHTGNPGEAYQALKDQPALTVEIASDGATAAYDFSLADLENILYGAGVDKRLRDNEGRQEKGYYAYRTYQGDLLQDLFEGINLEYLLTERIGLQGVLGSLELYSGDGAAPVAVYDLAAIGDKGYNSERGLSGLGMMVAFAKNGYPLVSGGGTTPGYVSVDPVTGKDVKNNGGPLQFVRGQNAAERDAGSVTESGDNRASVTNLTKIVVNLEADPYAHTGVADAELAKQEIAFSGAVAIEDGVSLSVGTIETKQKYIVDGVYTVGGAQEFYRGLDLYRLLNDKDVGASPLMSEIIVQNENGESKTLSYEELSGSSQAIILAYGSGSGAEAQPLSLAAGGPLRLIIDGGSADECIANVSRIIINAAEIDAWKHNFGVYAQYADFKLEISGANLVSSKTYSLAELEAMDNIIIQDSYKISNNTVIIQGVDLYKLLQNIGFANGLDSSVFTVFASDNYSPGAFTASQLKDGINGKPVLLAFGQGTTLENGLPLVPNDASPGYSGVSDNQGGPLRFVVYDNSGWSVKFLTRIVVGAAGGVVEPPGGDFAFNVYQTGVDGFPNAGARAVVPDNNGGFWVGTNGGGAVYTSPAGVMAIYATPELRNDAVTGIALDAAGGVWLAQGGTGSDQATHLGAAYFKDGQFTFFDTSNSGLPSNRVYGVDVGPDGAVWFASQYTSGDAGDFVGGVSKYQPAEGAWQTWTMADGLPTASGWTVTADAKGGAWLTTYRNSAVDTSPLDESYVYITAVGDVVTYPDLLGVDEFSWSRSVAVTPEGGAYVVRSSAGSNRPDHGGYLDYINPDGSVISYAVRDLVPDLLSKADPARNIYPTLRVAFVDAGGDLWLATDGLGVYRCAVDAAGAITVKEWYSSTNNSWPDNGSMDNVWSIYVSPSGTAYFGSNGGVAWANVGVTPLDPDIPDPEIPDPPEVDKEALEALVSEVSALVETDFTAASWLGFVEALTVAQTVLADQEAAQEDVDVALSGLQAAFDALEQAPVVEPIVVSATPAASVEKLSGNKNNLTVTVNETLSDGSTNQIKVTLSIDNNAAGTYAVGDYKVYVDTKGNDQIRECRIVE